MASNGKIQMNHLFAGILVSGKMPKALWLRYCFAVVIFLAALAGRFSLLPLEAGYGFLIFYPAVALSALFLGAGPGLLTMTLGAFGADFLYKPPLWSFGLTVDQTFPTVIFCFSGAIVCFLSRQMSRNAVDAYASQERMQSIFDANLDALLVIDASGVIAMANRQAESLLGFAHGELSGQSCELIVPNHFRANHTTLRSRFAALPVARPMGRGLATKALRKDGSEIDVEVVLSPIQTDQGLFVASTLRDISARNTAEAELRISATAFESNDGIMVTDADGVIQRINRAFTKISGYTSVDVVGKTPGLLKSARHDADFYGDIWRTITRTGGWQGEIWGRRKNGEEYPEWLTISAVKDNDGAVTHYVGTHSDITERKQADAEIKDLAFFDQLTGLPNRTLFTDQLKQEILDNTRSGNFRALLFIDLDNFKALNDTLGHDVGDKLLRQVAKRLITSVREVDTVARFGGDEFVVTLADLGTNERAAVSAAKTVAELILVSLRLPYRLGEVTYPSTASIGVTLFKGKQITFDDLMKQADLAMYQSKAAGRNTIRFFNPAMGAAIMERAALEKDLRQGLDEDHFLIYFQAQVTGERHLIGAEVLVRWQHPQRGIVLPVEFIPIAEETGLILPLGHWVLESACRQLARWSTRQDMAHLTVAVNVSARQFRQPDFVSQVLAVLKATGANPRRLKLELTESLLVDDVPTVIEKMFTLKGNGVGFTLDDFGTGYSSLSYLKTMPLDQLKIDQSFVRDILSDPNDAAIAKTIVALAQSLGLAVIAEGVETEQQRDFLARIGCHDYQGYLFGRPLPLDEFEHFATRIQTRR